MAIIVLAGCGTEEGPGDSAGKASSDGDASPRIVSFVPAVTQMLVDLGLGDRVVGVGHPDPAAPENVPRMGNYLDIDVESLAVAQPDVVITAATKDSPSARLQSLAERASFRLAAYPYPETIEEVLALLARPAGPQDDAASEKPTTPPLGRLLDKPDQARALRKRVAGKLEALEKRYANHPSPRVLLCIHTGPVMASGPGTVHDQLLGRINATNAADEASVTAPTYDRESLAVLDPDVIVLLMPGARPLTEDDPRLAEFQGLPVPAVRNDRIELINDPKCLLPSTNLPRIAERLGEVVHR